MTYRNGYVRRLSVFAVLLALAASGLAVWLWTESDESIDANCEVLGVLLESRADRDETAKLFAPIRRQNPEQWDRLIARAEAGDRKLLTASSDLSCDLPDRTAKKLRQ